MELTLIRGLPGSGKSTYARNLANRSDPRPVHVEADDYFTAGGEYFFNAEWLGDAHRRCHRLALAALDRGQDVIVANTFSQVWEMQGYLDMADIMTDVHVMCMTKMYGNVHDCPESVIIAQEKRWELYEGEVFVK